MALTQHNPPPALADSDTRLLGVFDQLRRLRRRLNRLALQNLLFSSLTLLAGAASLLIIGAFILDRGRFLVAAALLISAAATGLVMAVGRSWWGFASLTRAAELTDRRANLQGRLSTLVSLAQADRKSPLWSFLVEDAASQTEVLSLHQVQPRIVSLWLYGLLATSLLAGLAGWMMYAARYQQQQLNQLLSHLTLKVDPSQLAPADGAAGGGAKLVGDPRTLSDLARRLANASHSPVPNGLFQKLADRAETLTARLQDRLTGGQAPADNKNLKFEVAKNSTEPGADSDRSGDNSDQDALGQKNGTDRGKDDHSNPWWHNGPTAGAQDEPQAGNIPINPGAPGMRPPVDPNGLPAPGAGDKSGFVVGSKGGTNDGGANAGQGSDPDNLLGPPDLPGHKSDNYAITIDAHLSEHSAVAAAQPYIPPRVTTPLNAVQHPDEPVARSVVPPDDRDTIRRVFER